MIRYTEALRWCQAAQGAMRATDMHDRSRIVNNKLMVVRRSDDHNKVVTRLLRTIKKMYLGGVVVSGPEADYSSNRGRRPERMMAMRGHRPGGSVNCRPTGPGAG